MSTSPGRWSHPTTLSPDASGREGEAVADLRVALPDLSKSPMYLGDVLLDHLAECLPDPDELRLFATQLVGEIRPGFDCSLDRAVLVL